MKPNQFNTENVQSWLNTYEYVAVDEITWPLVWSDSFAEDPIAVLQNLAGTRACDAVHRAVKGNRFLMV